MIFGSCPEVQVPRNFTGDRANTLSTQPAFLSLERDSTDDSSLPSPAVTVNLSQVHDMFVV